MEKLKVSLSQGAPLAIEVGGNGTKKVVIGAEDKVIMSGPCSVEEYEVMREIVSEMKELGVDIIRGGAYKPRTSPYDFQGKQREGIKILHKVSREFGIPFVTEIMDAQDIEYIAEYADMLQVGTRNMYNYTLLKELGKIDKPILLKRGMSATIKEWLYSAEYIMKEGNEQVILCERGIRSFETYTRNTLDLNAVAYVKSESRLPIVVDPSHGTGIRNLVEPMSKASLAAGADGLIIESHIRPDEATSDAYQTIDMETLNRIIKYSK